MPAFIGKVAAGAPDSGTSPTAGDLDKEYVYTRPVKWLLIQNDPSNAGVNMYCKLNSATAASVSDRDFVLEPGDWFKEVDVEVHNVQVYFTGACTLGTHFTIRGRP